jgi:deoxyadenosine/deoxycytidine kinase
VAIVTGGVHERTIYENYEVAVRYYYESGRLSEMEFASLTREFTAMCAVVRPPDLAFNLWAPAEELFSRAKRRGRSDDRMLTLEFIRAIESMYRRMHRNWRLCPYFDLTTENREPGIVADEI